MTGNQRVLERLQHGPATAAELYRLGVIVHSRVSELRKAGNDISCERTPGQGPGSYLYRLVSSVPAAELPDSPSTNPDPAAGRQDTEQLVLV